MLTLLSVLVFLLVLALLLLLGISTSLHRLATHHERFSPPDPDSDPISVGYHEGDYVTLRYSGLEHRAVVLAQNDELSELTLELLPSAWTNERRIES